MSEKKSTVAKSTYSAADVAAYLGISRAAVYNLMNSHEFPSFRIGARILITRETFEAWVKQQQQERRKSVAH